MKKDKKFLNELESYLNDIRVKNKNAIIAKYENIIKTEKEKQKKITVILKELGKASDIALKEKELLKKDSFVYKLKTKFKNIKLFNKNSEKKKKLKEEKKKLKKEISSNKEKNKNKKSFKEFITEDISFSKKSEEKNLKEEIIENIKEANILEEAVEEVKDEISEVSQIVSEKRIFESKSDRIRRIIIKSLGVVITILLLFLWLWLTVAFLASIFAYLDGVKFIGINIALFGIDLLLLWIIILINKAIFKKKSKFLVNIIVSVVLIFIIAIGIALSLKQISEIKTVKDVSVKYSMTNKVNTYTLPSDEDKKFIINFNSNYKTQFLLEYDKTLKDKIKVEVKYYECYYDYYTKETSNNVYISLKLDNRDRFSVYVDDLKEGLVFDNDELSRYTVKIKVHPNNSSRLVILN